jgi:hypothetical protein
MRLAVALGKRLNFTKMRSMATLRLTEAEAQAFLKALAHYGFESGGGFLRACAHALIEHDKGAERLLSPLKFQGPGSQNPL